MLRKLRERAQTEQGFTLIELLVVILIIGILAAIAIPSFINQRGKGNDAEAKSTAVTASQAMETCSTDNNGSYTTCDLTALKSIEPTLNDAGARIAVSGTGPTSGYTIGVTSNRNSPNPVTPVLNTTNGGNVAAPATQGMVFQLQRQTNGATSRTCAGANVDRGGCSGTAAGSTW